jgi:peptidoglycan/xylan/chitin deacetylase (PgdA/CDA1 family)
MPSRMGISTAFVSQLCHLVKYSLKKPGMQLENAILVISVDVDVGNKELGTLNKGKNDFNVSARFSEYRVGEIEERALPLFADFFNNFDIPVTFALRGQLTEVDTSLLRLLAKSKHDVGSHGYYHKDFTRLTHDEAENELKMTSEGMKRFGIVPKSFVFPRNRVAHLDLLEKHGYKCYRDGAGFMSDGMYIARHGQLYDIHSSLFIGQTETAAFLKKIINVSIKAKLPVHFWFHLFNFGETRESMQRSIGKVFFPMFRYAKAKEKNGVLTFETMLSAAKKLKKCST